MNIAELNEVVNKTIDECKELLVAKGADYSDKNDRLNNFKQGADAIGLTAIQVWWIYFYKHYRAISSFVKNGAVASEPIEGRINDAINYLLLLRAILEEQRPAPTVSIMLDAAKEEMLKEADYVAGIQK